MLIRPGAHAGALYIEDFKRAAHAAGFLDPRMLAPASPIQVNDTVLQAVVGNAKFYSITFRLFKLPSLLETLCEDYGQIAIYKVCWQMTVPSAYSPIAQSHQELDHHERLSGTSASAHMRMAHYVMQLPISSQLAALVAHHIILRLHIEHSTVLPECFLLRS